MIADTIFVKRYKVRRPDVRITKGKGTILVEDYKNKSEFFGYETDPRIRKLVEFLS